MYKVIDEGEEVDLDAFEKEIGKLLQRVATTIQRQMSTPPPKKEKHLSGPFPGGFYSQKQRGFVMGGMRAGTLQVPYLRTGNLERSWSVSQVMKEKARIYVVVFSDPNEAPYNEWVQQTDEKSERQRVPMHSDWPSPDDVEEKEILDLLEKELRKLL